MMEELAKVPWAVIAPLIIVQIILMIVALIDLRKFMQQTGLKFFGCLLFYLLIY